MIKTRDQHAGLLQFFCALLLFAGVILTRSAEASESFHMQFDHVGTEDGLAQSTVMAIAQDQTGFLWFATESGIDRYDGFDFINYGRERGNQHALNSDFARDLHFDAQGRLWVATDGGGMSRWDPSTNSFKTWRHDPGDVNSLSSDRIRRVVTDSSGRIWIGTRGKGLNRLDPATGRITRFVHDPDDASSIAGDDIFALTVDGDSAVWVGTNAGLSRFDVLTNTFQRIAIAEISVRSMLLDANGNLWVGTNESGVIRVDTQSLDVVTLDSMSAKLGSDRVNVLYQDSGGRIWAGTTRGLSLWLEDRERFMTFKADPVDPSSLSDDNIISMFEDRGGVLWIGTLTSGLSKWNPRSWSFGHTRLHFHDDTEVGSQNITSFTEDREGAIWVGTFGGGISILDGDGNTVRVIQSDSNAGFSDDRVMAMTTDRVGNVWAGTMTGGLKRIDAVTGEIRAYVADPNNPGSLPANGIMALYESSDGYLWVGTFGGGVSRLDTESGRFTNFGHDAENPNSLSANRATAIAETGNGTVWVGTDGGGLNWFDESSGIWQSIRHDELDPWSLSDNTVYTLHVDSRDRLWVGTREGLDLLVRQNDPTDPWRVTSIMNDDGQAMSAVYGIKSDRNGRLWISTNHGLVTYDPASQRARSFHKLHGLQGEEFNFGASFASRSGKFYFGGASGYNAFRPEDLEFNTAPPPIALTSMSIMNEPVASHRPHKLPERLDLGFNDYVVTFTVAALDFSAPDKNKYAYKLAGLDENWVNLGNDRRITYTNLDGGDYVLQVKAANSDGIWNQAGINIPVSVANPPWATWWAYSFYVLAAGMLLLAFWRHQQNKLRRETEYARRLEQEVHQRTKQLNGRNKDLKIANARLLEASTTDPLTGLRNRRYLFEQITKDVDLVLRHYRDGSQTMSPAGNNDLLFLMVDLDNFKPVNDTCGHEAGDELLLQIRDVLLDACRSSDDIIRWGGDEFLVVARETNRRYAATLAERIRSSLSQRVFPLGDGQTARITTSIGYASFPFLKDRPELLSWEETLGVADAAMYEAKQRRNAWTGIEGIHWSADGEDLCRAIKLSPGELAEEGCIRAFESIDDVVEASA